MPSEAAFPEEQLQCNWLWERSATPSGKDREKAAKHRGLTEHKKHYRTLGGALKTALFGRFVSCSS
jgi:hypothetical protein